MSSIETVATNFEQDFKKYLTGNLSKLSFDEEYGHLRAGTYDIRTKRYDQMNFSIKKEPSFETAENTNMPHELPKAALLQALADFDFHISYDDFVSFLKNAIEQREAFKFVFTKSLSRAIEVAAEIGSMIGINRNDMSYLEVPQIISAQLYDSKESVKEIPP